MPVNQPSIIKKLKLAGERITPLRRALLELLLKATTPKTVPELLVDLSKRGFDANKTTLYRQLEALESCGVVSAVHFVDQIKRYEIVDEHGHHHHLVCLSCGRISDVSFSTDLRDQEREILKKNKFTVLQHSLEFFGICKDCSDQK